MSRERILMMAAIGALAVIAVFGWTRHSETAPQAVLPNASVAPVYDAGAGYADNAPVADTPSYAYSNSIRTISPAPALAPQYPAPEPAPQYRDGDNYVNRDRYEERGYVNRGREENTRVVTRERPTSHSLAIVGGSAGAGAAIGALAGGGKGAGIGALSGGAAGFLYDRLTHRKQVVVQQ